MKPTTNADLLCRRHGTPLQVSLVGVPSCPICRKAVAEEIRVTLVTIQARDRYATADPIVQSPA